MTGEGSNSHISTFDVCSKTDRRKISSSITVKLLYFLIAKKFWARQQIIIDKRIKFKVFLSLPQHPQWSSGSEVYLAITPTFPHRSSADNEHVAEGHCEMPPVFNIFIRQTKPWQRKTLLGTNSIEWKHKQNCVIESPRGKLFEAEKIVSCKNLFYLVFSVH